MKYICDHANSSQLCNDCFHNKPHDEQNYCMDEDTCDRTGSAVVCIPYAETTTNRDPKSRHYDAGGVEVQDVIKAKLTPEQYEGWLLGNVIKYSLRMNFKGQKERDKEKVAFYSKWLRDEQEINYAKK